MYPVSCRGYNLANSVFAKSKLEVDVFVIHFNQGNDVSLNYLFFRVAVNLYS